MDKDKPRADQLTVTQRALVAVRELRRENKALRARQSEPIAIVGMACRFPGGANTPEDYWELLAGGVDAIGPMPRDRWDWPAYYDPQPDTPGKMYVDRGGFIGGIDVFDNELFNIEPEEALAMDPQQRILLELCWEALERAGIAPAAEDHRDTVTGVFMGMASSGYSRYSTHSGDPTRINRHSITGTAFSIAAGRIAYVLGLQGPALAIDTACSSSLVAMHLACQSLRHAECDQALVGGINLLLSPEEYVYFCRTGALSVRSCCRAFDEDADGYVRSEGGGVVVLKRLSDALASGDSVLAVIRGSAINHDGRSNGLTAPNGIAQQRLLRQAWKAARIAGSELSFVEAHGTGTPLGDPIELNALGHMLAMQRSPSAAPCYVGTCKANLGHLEAAAGVASLIKVVLALQHRVIPPNLHFDSPNRHVRWNELPIAVATAPTEWSGPDQNRLAGISSFGFAGTNAHLVIEEATAATDPDLPAGPKVAAGSIIVLSAKSDDRLRARAADLASHLRHQEQLQDSPESLLRLAYTLQVGRAALEARLAVTPRDVADLIAALESHVAQAPHPRLIAQRANVAVDGPAGETELGELPAGRLAEHWVAGGNVDWQSLYGTFRTRRSSLPTYPFVRNRFWPEAARRAEGKAEVERAAAGKSDDPEWDGSDPLSHVLRMFSNEADLPLDKVRASGGPHELSIDSVRLMRVRFRLEQHFEIRVPMHLFGPAASWSDLVQHVAATEGRGELRAAEARDAQPAPRAVNDGAGLPQQLPLSDLQQAYVIGRQMGSPEQRVGCHIYLELEVAELDVARLAASWNRLVQRHEMLRAEFQLEGLQCIPVERGEYQITVHDLRDATPAEIAKHFSQLRRRMSHRVYEPGEWPLFAIEATRYEGGAARVHFSIDEVIADGASLSILLRQWQTLYLDSSVDLPSPSYSFGEFVEYQKRLEATPRFEQDLAYWLERCRDLPGGPTLPFRDSPPSTLQPGDVNRRRRFKGIMSLEQWQEFKRRADANGVSPTVLMLVAFSEVLGGGDPMRAYSLVLTLANRMPIHPGIDELVGPVASTGLFIREPTTGDNLKQHCLLVQQHLWRDFEHTSVSGVRILRELKRRGQLKAEVSLPVVFTSMVENYTVSEFEENWSSDWVYGVTQTPQIYLDHQACVKYGALHFSWDVAICKLPEIEAEKLFRRYQRALGLLASKEEVLLSSLRGNGAAVPAAPVVDARGAGGPRCRVNEAPMAAVTQEPFPVTDLQAAYVFSRHTEGAATVIYQEFDVQDLIPARLEQAWNTLIARHDMLRVVVQDDGMQRIRTGVPRYQVAVHEASDASGSSDFRQELRAQMVNNVRATDEWPFFDLQVSRAGDQDWRVHLVIDMLVADWPSIAMLYEQLFALYADPRTSIVPTTGAYRGYLDSVSRQASDAGKRAAARAYWQAKLSGLPLSRRASPAGSPERVRLEGSLSDWPLLRERCGSAGIAPQDVLLAAYGEALRSITDSEPFSVVVVDFARRGVVEGPVLQTVGDFTSLGWVAFDAEPSAFMDTLDSCREQTTKDYAQWPISGLTCMRSVLSQRLAPGCPPFPFVFSRLLEHGGVSLAEWVSAGSGMSRTPGVWIDNVSVAHDSKIDIHWDVEISAFANGVVEAAFESYLTLLSRLASDSECWGKPVAV